MFLKYYFPTRIPYPEELRDPWLRSVSVYFYCCLHNSEGHLLWFLMVVFPLNETSIENSDLWRPVTPLSVLKFPGSLTFLCAFSIYVFFLVFKSYFRNPNSLFLFTVPLFIQLTSQRWGLKLCCVCLCFMSPHWLQHLPNRLDKTGKGNIYFYFQKTWNSTVMLSDDVTCCSLIQPIPFEVLCSPNSSEPFWK